jgi:hypothetical protein
VDTTETLHASPESGFLPTYTDLFPQGVVSFQEFNTLDFKLLGL